MMNLIQYALELAGPEELINSLHSCFRVSDCEPLTYWFHTRHEFRRRSIRILIERLPR